ncbi:MAG TPA: uroporphyrinogen decarboxylase [Rhizomicrobium sp.]
MKKEGKLAEVLDGKAVWPPPIWLMRQAGRYLPEYRALRAKAGSFWAMCMDPAMATEITLQPIRRFGFDAAIIFSDILTVPFALGSIVTFTEGEGPSLPPVSDVDGLECDPEIWRQKLSAAYETLRRVRGELDAGTALLGFAGAPWTLATYMAAGRGGDEQRAAKAWGARDPDGFQRLLDLLGDCVMAHLVAQLDAGADAVQLFDSWANGLDDVQFRRWVAEPTRRIVDGVRAQRPGARFIGFPRAVKLEQCVQFANAVHPDAISIGTDKPLRETYDVLGGGIALQGNLDPELLIAGGAAMARGARAILDEMRGGRLIFNLGHGVLQQTSPEHVAELVRLVRAP